MFSTNTYIEIITQLSIQSKGPNKYLNWYLSIIKKAKTRTLNAYTENHHIVPDCFFIDNKRNTKNGFLVGHGDHKDNFAKLSAEEHQIAHLLLVKMFNGDFRLHKSLVYSAIRMSSDRHGDRINNKTYGWLRRLHSRAMTGKNNPCYNRIWINNGIVEDYIINTENIPEGWVKGQLTRNQFGENNPNYKKKWINNGIIEDYVSADFMLPETWSYGRISSKKPPTKKNTLIITDGIIQKSILKTDNIPTGWRIGSIYKGRTQPKFMCIISTKKEYTSANAKQHFPELF